MEILLTTDKGLQRSKLKNVAFIPSFFTSLVSLTRLSSSNVHFDSGRSILFRSTQVVANLTKLGGHWLIVHRQEPYRAHSHNRVRTGVYICPSATPDRAAWAVGFCVVITISYIGDRFNCRGAIITTASIIGGVGWLTAGLLPPDAYTKRYGCLCLAACGAFPAAPSMTNWVTCNTPSFLTIPLAIALHNSSAGIGQIIAQWIWKVGEKEAGYPTGNFVCAACSFFVAVVAVGLRITYGVMNKRDVRDASGGKRVWAY